MLLHCELLLRTKQQLPDQWITGQEKQLNIHDAVLIAEEMISELMVWTSRIALLKSYLREAVHVVPNLLTRELEAKSYSRLQDLQANFLLCLQCQSTHLN
jgi:hypothetical protein